MIGRHFFWGGARRFKLAYNLATSRQPPAESSAAIKPIPRISFFSRRWSWESKCGSGRHGYRYPILEYCLLFLKRNYLLYRPSSEPITASIPARSIIGTSDAPHIISDATQPNSNPCFEQLRKDFHASVVSIQQFQPIPVLVAESLDISLAGIFFRRAYASVRRPCNRLSILTGAVATSTRSLARKGSTGSISSTSPATVATSASYPPRTCTPNVKSTSRLWPNSATAIVGRLASTNARPAPLAFRREQSCTVTVLRLVSSRRRSSFSVSALRS
jgi:hypothetical protein